MEEVWKSVGIVRGVDFTGLYEASNLGYIRSIDSICEYIDGRKRHLKGRVLRPSIDKKGYSSVTLYKNGLKVCIRVHRLVLQTFEPNPNPEIYTEINHIDENKKNNCLNNLEWCTRQYNNTYGTRLERVSRSRIKHELESRCLSFIPVVQLDLDGNILNVYYQEKDITTKNNNFSYKYITKRINKGINIAYGFFWIKLDKYNELTQNELLNLIKKGIDRSDENLNKRKTCVAILDLQGNFIKKFDSIASAESFLNCCPSTVSSCLKGRSKTAKGYKCVYLENYQNKY